MSMIPQHLTHFSRSQQLESQRCPYRGWLSYGYRRPGAAVAGITPTRFRSGMSIGTSVHEGMAKALRGGSEVESIGTALEDWLRKEAMVVGEHGEPLQEFNLRQGRCFVEQLTRLAYRLALPDLRQRYRLTEVERELKVTLPLDPPLQWSSRIDGGLEEVGGMLSAHGVLSWKTCAQWDDRKKAEAMLDVQGLSEPFAAERVLGRRFDFVQMVYLVKGRKSERDPTGRWFHYSPLTTGMRTGPAEPGKPRYSWEYAKGMERFFLFEPQSPFTPLQWFDMLQANQVPPFDKEPLWGSVKILDPIWRDAHSRALWLTQLTPEVERMRLAYRSAESLDPNEPEDQLSLAKILPRYTQSCLWPVKCQYHDHCWRGERLDGPGWAERVPNHPEDDDSA